MRIGLRIPPCAPVPEIAALARDAERAGFDEVWFPDSQLLWRDVFAVDVPDQPHVLLADVAERVLPLLRAFVGTAQR